jgi:carboxyl-terminal processing protease
LTRAEIQVKSVKAKIIEPGYAWIRITSFQETTTPELAAKLRNLAKSTPPLKGLILDLRNNGGGLLQSAVGVAGAFLPENSVVVSTKGRLPSAQQTYRDIFSDYQLPSFKSDPLKGLPELSKTVPMVVLTNGYTASASEIVAGALQDYHRAKIMGKTTFGKGSVQTVRPLTADTALRLTTAYYYTPDGRSIQNRGIKPDLAVDQYADGDPDDALISREADYSNHLANLQDPDEQKEAEQRRLKRLQALRYLESQPAKQRSRDQTPPEFGSPDDFMLKQALNELKGQPVVLTKVFALPGATTTAQPADSADQAASKTGPETSSPAPVPTSAPAPSAASPQAK